MIPEHGGLSLLGAVLLATMGSAVVGASSGPDAPPWQTWDDLHRLAVLTPGAQALLRSSHCPSGCRYDRHSSGDWRYIRVDGDEGVIFQEEGAGAITRIWVTQGSGQSLPLSPGIQLRIYVDGSVDPIVDLPLPALFDGSTAPFLPPLVGDRAVSSGGYFSYVPMPYRHGCRVTLEGAHDEKIWFQFSFHRLAEPGSVESFTGNEDLSAWSRLLSMRGEDPWTPGPNSDSIFHGGQVALAPGQGAVAAELPGPDSVTAIHVDTPPEFWPAIEVTLTFDGEDRVRMPLSDFFAVGREATRSLFLGAGEDGVLYAYFPMPFFQSAQVAFERVSSAPHAPIPLSWELRTAGIPLDPGSGLFGAQLYWDEETPVGVDIPLLELDGHGLLPPPHRAGGPPVPAATAPGCGPAGPGGGGLRQ